MKMNFLCSVNLKGGFQTSTLTSTSNQISSIIGWRATRTVVGIKCDWVTCHADCVWSLELTGNVYHNWEGHRISINCASVISNKKGQLYAIGGTDRFLLEEATGEIIAHTSSQSSPTDYAFLGKDELIIPEGQLLSAYDPISLDLKWSKTTPNNKWMSSSPINNVVLLQDEPDKTTIIWNFRTDQIWEIPKAICPIQVLSISDDLVVISAGFDSTRQLIAFDLKDGLERWSYNYAENYESHRYDNDQTPRLDHPLIREGESMFVATMKPSLEAVSLVNGTQLWSVDLTSKPTALALQKEADLVWVSTATGEVISVDLKSGVIVDHSPGVILSKLNGMDCDFPYQTIPISILPISDQSIPATAIITMRLGGIYYITS